MNSAKHLLLLILISTALLACKRDDDDDQNTSKTPFVPTTTFKMEAMVNGEKWTTNDVSASFSSGFIITGLFGDSGRIIVRTADLLPDEYLIDTDKMNHYPFSRNMLEVINDSYTNLNLGKVTITNNDFDKQLVSGSFEASSEDMEITSGKLNNISYEKADTVFFECAGLNNGFDATITGDQNAVIGSHPIVNIGCGVLLTSQNALYLFGGNFTLDHYIGAFIPAGIAPGTYTIESSNPDLTWEYRFNHNQFFEASDGKMTITRHDEINNTIEGTFSFNGAMNVPNSGSTGKVNVANGSFNIVYDEN